PACGSHGDRDPVHLRKMPGRVVSFTADHLAPSVDSPVVLAVLDLEGGGRRSAELTDVGDQTVQVGDTVVPTFRRLFTSEGIHNYFWKARPEARG
ncbi:MAG: OB-fold domain-containing protein, partial [Patulibacter sp.]